MPLADEFKRFKKVSGVYIISELSSPQSKMTSKITVKIGKAKDLSKRLNDYHTCFKESFYTFSILETKNDYYANKLESHILKSLKPYQYVPKHYIARLSHLGNEWFEAKKSTLLEELKKALHTSNVVVQVHNFHDRYFHLPR